MVSPIGWAEVLETGIPELDDEHRLLIDQCNALTAAMIDQRPWADVVEAARRLSATCSDHFRSEEALLERIAFPRCEQHALQHREIERRFGELLQLLSSVDGTKETDRAAVSAMRGTLIEILFRHDLDYKSHLQHATGL